MSVSAAVTWTQECSSSAHAQTPTFTEHCLSIKWVDQGVVYPIRLSGLFSYRMAQEQRCPDNRGSTVPVNMAATCTASERVKVN